MSNKTTKWTTVDERPYSPVTNNDGPAAGGVVLIQRRKRRDQTQERRVASNTGRTATGKPYTVT